jgi:sec-independent protein translocase protein TatA
MLNPMIGMPEGAEWFVILAIVVLVFGAAKLPDLARGTGQALRIFKAETKGLRSDDESAAAPTPPPSQLPMTSTDEMPVTPQTPVTHEPKDS